MDGTQTKVVALNGSARKGGNTAILLRYVLKELEQEGIETELIELSGAKIHGCLACRKCSARKDRRCSQTGDMGNVYIEKMEAADGILLGSPTYVADISPEIKALMDRACLVSKANGGMFRRKVGAAVGRYAGGSNSCLRYLKPFFPDQRNDRARFVVLEHWLRS